PAFCAAFLFQRRTLAGPGRWACDEGHSAQRSALLCSGSAEQHLAAACRPAQSRAATLRGTSMQDDRRRPTRRTVLAGLVLGTLAIADAATPVLADPPSPGSSIRGATTATAAEVQGIMGKEGERVTIIDARRPGGGWDKGHIARALKLNWRYSNVTQSWQF